MDVSNAALSVRLLPGTPTHGVGKGLAMKRARWRIEDPELKVGGTWRQYMVALPVPE